MPPRPSPGPLDRPRPAGPRSARRPASAAGRRPARPPWRTAGGGSLAIAFRQIVSRSRGTRSLSYRGGFGSSWRTWCSSIRALPRNGQLAGQQLGRGSRPGCRRRCGHRRCGPRRGPARGSCRRACPAPGRRVVIVISPASRLARPKSITTGVPSRPEHDVRGLHVAVDDACRWACSSASATAAISRGGLAERRRPAVRRSVQRHALDEVADQVRDAVLLADLVHRHDRRVAQLGRGPRLAEEAIAAPGRRAGCPRGEPLISLPFLALSFGKDVDRDGVTTQGGTPWLGFACS